MGSWLQGIIYKLLWITIITTSILNRKIQNIEQDLDKYDKNCAFSQQDNTFSEVYE